MAPEVSIAPKSARMERRRIGEIAWQRYIREGLEPAGIPSSIFRSWRRSRDAYHIDPSATRPAWTSSPDALFDRQEHDEGLRIALPILRDFTDRAGLCDHALAWLDGEGWMLAIDGDRRTMDHLAEIGFQPGTNWAEASAGTNGPGTALAERRPFEVFACEHFVEAWQPWSCAAAPIFLPGGADVAGLVDITGPWEVRRRQALLLARAIARAVEERLRAAMSVRDEVVRYAFRAAHEAGDALVAVDPRGRILAASDAVARRHLLDADGLPLAVREVVARVVRAPAPGHDGEICIDLPESPPVAVAPVRHDGAPVGAILRFGAGGKRRAPARARPTARYEFGAIVGRSDACRRAVSLAVTASRNDLPVVIAGESGTGKEMFAQAIHAASARKAGPFVAVNCAAIPEQLVEAELFGYEPGTFTGARRDGNPGRFEDADGGTLLLDEISDLPAAAQAALLRVLQEKHVVRLGSSAPRPVDVRVVAATNRSLEDEVRSRRFRTDLYFRLNVLRIAVPPLRERGDDVLELAEVFLAEADVDRRGLTLAPDAAGALRAHPWPGNVRELRNVIQRAAATAAGPRITTRDLLLDACPLDPPPGVPVATSARVREAVVKLERDALLGALDANEWNFTRAAQQLGISRMTLYRWAKKHGVSRAAGQGGPGAGPASGL